MASSAPPDLTSRILRHDRLIVGAVIGLLVALSWWFLATGAGMPEAMDGMAMAPPPVSALVTMWWLMMVAMMLPSAAPAILLYAQVRRIRGGDGVVARSSIFLAGYAVAWLLFSIGAAVAQWLLAGMALEDPRLAAAVLIAAGLYQLSPLKSSKAP